MSPKSTATWRCHRMRRDEDNRRGRGGTADYAPQPLWRHVPTRRRSQWPWRNVRPRRPFAALEQFVFLQLLPSHRAQRRNSRALSPAQAGRATALERHRSGWTRSPAMQRAAGPRINTRPCSSPTATGNLIACPAATPGFSRTARRGNCHPHSSALPVSPPGRIEGGECWHLPPTQFCARSTAISRTI